ncbi:MAG: hypothetical protein ACREBP_04300, partial [Sphingomicrobium sp.]
ERCLGEMRRVLRPASQRMTEDGGGLLRLLLVVASAEQHAHLEAALAGLAGAGEVRSPALGAFVVHVAMPPSELRDELRQAACIDSLFIVEFERWSALGDAIGPAWLLRRGH